MKREHLMGFAGGAGTTASISIAAFLLIPAKAPSRPVLLVYDKGAPLEDIKADPTNGMTAGRLVHGCRTKNFSFKQATATDSSNYIEAPLSDENLAGVECVLKKASGEGYDFRLILKTQDYVQTH